MRYLVLLILVMFTACEQQDKGVALGTLMRDRIALTATVNEVIVSLPVAPGSVVKKGMVIVQLDDTLQKAMVNKSLAEVAQSEANLDKLRNGARVEDVASARAKVAGAEAALIESEANYSRAIELKQSQVISESDLDRIVSTRDANQAQLARYKEELLKLTNGTRIEDLRGAKAQLDASIATLENEKKKFADLTIRATRDGILDNLPWNLGERVTVGSPLAIVLAGDAPHARVYVPEPYRVKLKTGDKLNVLVDGLDNSIEGTLRWISTEPAFTPYYALNQEERSRLMYLAEVQLPANQSDLPNGVPAQVELP